MSKNRVNLLILIVLSLTAVLVFGGCGGGGGSSSSNQQSAAKAAISGTVSFPSLGSMVAKQVSKSVAAPAYGVPIVELRNLSGGVVATATVTGTAPGPFSYTFSNIDMGADYVVKAYVPNSNYVVKALIDKSTLLETTTRNVDTVSTAVVIVAEQKLGASPGTMGDTANAAKINSDAIAGVNPAALESAVNTAIGTVTGANAVNATSNDVTLINLVNVVTATVFNGVKTSDFIAGTVTTPISTTQYSFVAAGSAPVVDTTAVIPSSTVYTNIVAPTLTAYTPPDPNTVTFTSRVIDNSTAVALAGVEVTANGLKTYTDASGFFTLAGITKNTSFYVKMSKAGYADTFSALMNIAANSNSSTRPYSLFTPAAVTALGNNAGAGMISSRVVTSTNLETGYLSGVVVTATDSLDPSVTYPVIYKNATTNSLDPSLTSTDTNGNYMFRNIPAGRTVVVTATKAGYTFNTRTFQIVADSVSQGRLVGTASATPPATSSAIKDALMAGMSDIRNNNVYDQATSTSINYYSIERMGLASDGVTLTKTTPYYFDRVSKTWINSVPAGYPTNNNINYSLSSSGAWVVDDAPQGFTAVFNADGSARLTSPKSTEIVDVTVNAVNLAGLPIPTSGLDGLPILATASGFPSGAVAYQLNVTSITDTYQLWSSYSNLTALASVPTAFVENNTNGMSIYFENNSQTEFFYGNFAVGSSTAVNIYRGTNTGTMPTLIGTATAATSTVLGQQIMEIVIPSAVKTTYGLIQNPIFAVNAGVVMQGAHSPIGPDANKGGNMYNDIAINHIKANINTALAKPVVAKQLSKAILGW